MSNQAPPPNDNIASQPPPPQYQPLPPPQYQPQVLPQYPQGGYQHQYMQVGYQQQQQQQQEQPRQYPQGGYQHQPQQYPQHQQVRPHHRQSRNARYGSYFATMIFVFITFSVIRRIALPGGAGHGLISNIISYGDEVKKADEATVLKTTAVNKLTRNLLIRFKYKFFVLL